MFQSLKNLLRREQFCPSLLGMFCNPFYIARKALFKELKSLAPHVSGHVLDIGCGRKPYANLFNCEKYIGLEVDTLENRKKNYADLFYNRKTIPSDNNFFDCVICTQVFEHVFTPDEFLKEIKRVLKPGGKILLTVPFVWDEHEQPFDYARYSSFGLKYVLEKHNFDVLVNKKTCSDLRVIFQLINGYIYKMTSTKHQPLNFLFWFLFTSPINILGEILSKFFPTNNDLYLDNIIVARKRLL